jgi:ABC-type Fe3+-citrate transport system substrate-binding protein
MKAVLSKLLTITLGFALLFTLLPANLGQAKETKWKYTIKTSLGNVTLNEIPKNIIVLDSYLLDIVTALGVKPVGVAQEDPTNKELPDYLKKYVKHKFTWVGDRKQPSLEIMASLKPDLIIGDVTRHKEALPMLKKLAPTALFTGSGDDDWKLIIEQLGGATNKKNKAKAVVAQYKKDVEAANKKVGTVEVLPVGNYAKNQVRIFTRDSFTGDVLNDMGLKIPFSADGKPFVYVSREKLHEIKTDAIFLLTSPKWTENVELKDAPVWKDLPAVKAGNVHTVSLETWTFYRGPLAAKVILNDVVKSLSKK